MPTKGIWENSFVRYAYRSSDYFWVGVRYIKVDIIMNYDDYIVIFMDIDIQMIRGKTLVDSI